MVKVEFFSAVLGRSTAKHNGLFRNPEMDPPANFGSIGSVVTIACNFNAWQDCIGRHASFDDAVKALACREKIRCKALPDIPAKSALEAPYENLFKPR